MKDEDRHIPYLSKPHTLRRLSRFKGKLWQPFEGGVLPRIRIYDLHTCEVCKLPIEGPSLIILGDGPAASASGLVEAPNAHPVGHLAVIDNGLSMWLCPEHYAAWLNPWHKLKENPDGV